MVNYKKLYISLTNNLNQCGGGEISLTHKQNLKDAHWVMIYLQAENVKIHNDKNEITFSYSDSEYKDYKLINGDIIEFRTADDKFILGSGQIINGVPTYDFSVRNTIVPSAGLVPIKLTTNTPISQAIEKINSIVTNNSLIKINGGVRFLDIVRATSGLFDTIFRKERSRLIGTLAVGIFGGIIIGRLIALSTHRSRRHIPTSSSSYEDHELEIFRHIFHGTKVKNITSDMVVEITPGNELSLHDMNISSIDELHLYSLSYIDKNTLIDYLESIKDKLKMVKKINIKDKSEEKIQKIFEFLDGAAVRYIEFIINNMPKNINFLQPKFNDAEIIIRCTNFSSLAPGRDILHSLPNSTNTIFLYHEHIDGLTSDEFDTVKETIDILLEKGVTVWMHVRSFYPGHGVNHQNLNDNYLLLNVDIDLDYYDIYMSDFYALYNVKKKPISFEETKT